MNYQTIRNNVKQAGVDLLELGRELEQGILNRDPSALKQAGGNYLRKGSSMPVVTTVPLGLAASGINSIDAAQGDISAEEAASPFNTGRAYATGAGLAAGLTAPLTAQLFKRDAFLEAVAEADRLDNNLKALGITQQELEDGWNAYVENAANNAEDELAPEKAQSTKTKRERYERAQQLSSKDIPAAQRRVAGLRNQRRAMGAGMTAAGLGIAGLAMAFNDRTPDVVIHSLPGATGPFVLPTPAEPYSATNIPAYVSADSWGSYYPGREFGA